LYVGSSDVAISFCSRSVVMMRLCIRIIVYLHRLAASLRRSASYTFWASQISSSFYEVQCIAGPYNKNRMLINCSRYRDNHAILCQCAPYSYSALRPRLPRGRGLLENPSRLVSNTNIGIKGTISTMSKLADVVHWEYVRTVLCYHCSCYSVHFSSSSTSSNRYLHLDRFPRYVPQALGNGHPITPMFKNDVLSISLFFCFNSSTSQFAQTYFPFKNLASGLATQTLNDAGKLTSSKISSRTSASPSEAVFHPSVFTKPGETLNMDSSGCSNAR
jgi:hypothetical protein